MNHPFFGNIARTEVTETSLDDFIATLGFKCLFLWGHNCPNCEIAKRSLVEYKTDLDRYQIEWAHCNVYEHSEVANRYGLHGIPVFLFFKDSKLLGKATSYPGWEQFEQILKKVSEKSVASL